MCPYRGHCISILSQSEGFPMAYPQLPNNSNTYAQCDHSHTPNRHTSNTKRQPHSYTSRHSFPPKLLHAPSQPHTPPQQPCHALPDTSTATKRADTKNQMTIHNNATNIPLRVIDGFFFHLHNEDKKLYRYPISLLVGKEGHSPQQNCNYFIRILKVFSIKPKGQYEWDQRSIHRRKLKLDVGCFCVGKVDCKKLKWEKTCDNLCPCMDCGGCWV